MTPGLKLTAIAAALALAMPAAAQTSPSKLTTSAASASTGKCPAVPVEIAPASFDTSGVATAWVMVHRVKGEIVAAERISERQVEQFRKLPCAGRAAMISSLLID